MCPDAPGLTITHDTDTFALGRELRSLLESNQDTEGGLAVAQPKLDHVLSHWHKPVADFQTPVQEFYEAVTAAFARRNMPGVTFSRVLFHERGAATARREYLRVRRGRFIFDICAAPFGEGFFFSWWLVEHRHKYALLFGLALAVGVFYLPRIPPIGFILVIVLSPLTALGNFIPYSSIVMEAIYLLTSLMLIGRFGGTLGEEAVLSIPVVGWIYAKLFSRETYYSIDTIEAYQAGVHGAVIETLESVLSARGVRALTEEEKKPILQSFLRR